MFSCYTNCCSSVKETGFALSPRHNHLCVLTGSDLPVSPSPLPAPSLKRSVTSELIPFPSQPFLNFLCTTRSQPAFHTSAETLLKKPVPTKSEYNLQLFWYRSCTLSPLHNFSHSICNFHPQATWNRSVSDSSTMRLQFSRVLLRDITV